MNELATLIVGLQGSDATVRLESAQRLAELGEGSQPAALALIDGLALEDDELQEWCVAALEGMGVPSEINMCELIDRIDSKNELVGYWACTLLGRLEDRAAGAVAALANAIGAAPHASVRQRAAWAIGRIGKADAAARKSLEIALSSDDPRLARLAKSSLESINPTPSNR